MDASRRGSRVVTLAPPYLIGPRGRPARFTSIAPGPVAPLVTGSATEVANGDSLVVALHVDAVRGVGRHTRAVDVTRRLSTGHSFHVALGVSEILIRCAPPPGVALSSRSLLSRDARLHRCGVTFEIVQLALCDRPGNQNGDSDRDGAHPNRLRSHLLNVKRVNAPVRVNVRENESRRFTQEVSCS